MSCYQGFIYEENVVTGEVIRTLETEVDYKISEILSRFDEFIGDQFKIDVETSDGTLVGIETNFEALTGVVIDQFGRVVCVIDYFIYANINYEVKLGSDVRLFI